MAQELGVKIIACQMTMDVMSLDKDQFIEGIEVGEQRASSIMRPMPISV